MHQTIEGITYVFVPWTDKPQNFRAVGEPQSVDGQSIPYTLRNMLPHVDLEIAATPGNRPAYNVTPDGHIQLGIIGDVQLI